jgi:hypothetical protein
MEPQPESIAIKAAETRLGSFLKFIPEVYWIIDCRLRESLDLCN